MRRYPSNARPSVGRWCSRALLVLGGAAAGTAAAWVLSTSAASASTSEDAGSGTASDVQHVTEAAASGFGDITSGVSKLVGGSAEEGSRHGNHDSGADDSKVDTSGKPADDAGAGTNEPSTHRANADGGDTGQAHEARPAVRQFAQEALFSPVQRTVTAVGHVLTEPEDTPRVLGQALTPPDKLRDIGDRVWEFVKPGDGQDLVSSQGSQNDSALSASDGTVGADVIAAEERTVGSRSVTDPGRVAAEPSFTGIGASVIQAMEVHGWQGESAPLSPLSYPLAPVTTPAAPAGTAHSSHIDGPQFGCPVAALSAFDSAEIGSIRSGDSSLLLQPEPQPGVAPD